MKYHIEEFVVDTDQFKITLQNSAISIEPKVFDLIVYLIENRVRIISRDELFDKIWQGREVSDTSLSNHIKTARKVFGDNGELQHTVKTIRGRGYQFVAKVVLPSSDEQSFRGQLSNESNHVSEKSPINLKMERKSQTPFVAKLGVLFISIIVLVLAIQFISWSRPEADRPVTNEDSKPYIVVVPFGVSGSKSEKWHAFADQITRETILKLRQISGLKVIPASSAFTFKDNQSHQYIRQQLPGIQFVLNAIVSVEGDLKIKISTQLEDLKNEKLVWSDSYLGRIDDNNYFTMQTDIATSVSGSLQVAILANEKRVLGEQLTSNLAAYEYYVAGQYELNKLTHRSLEASIAFFNKAIELDPKFHAAMVAKADAYRIIMSYFEKPIDVLPKVVESVISALEVKPNSAKAHSSLGLAYAFAWRWEDAWNMLTLAKTEDPSLALTELGFALYYSGIGDIEGVRLSLKRADDLDPLNVELADWGHWSLAMVGENDGAIEWAKRKIRLHPKVGMLYSGASVSASLAGEHQAAIELAKKGIELDSGSPYPLLALAQTYGHAGMLSKIVPLITQAENMNSFLCPYETAVTYLLLNENDKAFERLNKAVEYRSNCLVFTRNDPRLQTIRNDQRYKALLTRVGLDEQAIKRYPR